MRSCVVCLTLLSGLTRLTAAELIINGGFETLGSGWSLEANGANAADSWWNINQATGAHGGSRYQYLGMKQDGTTAANNVDGLLYQQVSIPSGVTAANLSYWTRISTSETGGTAYDLLKLEIRSSSGSLMKTVDTYSNLNVSGWTRRTADLTQYAGNTVRIVFHGTTDSSTSTTFRVDDVSLVTEQGAALPQKAVSPTPANGGTASSPATLSWSNGGGATGYRVYFGTDSSPDDGEDQGARTGTTFTTPSLTAGTTYYWKINATNTAGETPGDVWSFTAAQTVAKPVVRTDAATNVGTDTATLNATVTGTGGAAITDARFEYTSGSFPGTVLYSVPVSGGTFSQAATGLQPGTTYTVHAYAKNSTEWSDASNNLTFTTATDGGGGVAPPMVQYPSPNHEPRPAGQVIDAIVIHTLEDTYVSGRNTLTNPAIEKSAHYVISGTGEISQLVSPDRRAWHANYFNDRSIGIEMAGFAGRADTWNPANMAALESLVAWLAKKYGIPVYHPGGSARDYPPQHYYSQPGLVAHAQIQDGSNEFDYRSDPGPYFPWGTFVQNVQARMAGNSDATSPSIQAFGVSPGSVAPAGAFTASFTVADAGGSGLKQVELWRASVDGTESDTSWQLAGTAAVSGSGPFSGTFTDAPPAAGSYWYGLHVVDGAGNLMDERTAGLGPVQRTVGGRITVTSPDGGETWQAGTSHTIAWSSAGFSGNVRIVLSVNGNPQSPDIASSTANTGSYLWTVPAWQNPQTNYEIYIEQVDGGAWDLSDGTFAIAPAPSRVISLAGNLAFGNVNAGSSSTAVLQISNTGSAALTVGGIAFPAGFSGSWTGGTIAPGGTQPVTVTFSPVAAAVYGGTVTVSSDSTGGTNTVTCAGTGVAVLGPLAQWRQSQFGSTENAGDGADDYDYDHDGIPNLLEFAFGLNPKQNRGEVLPAAQRSGSNLVVTFIQPAAVGGITYGAEWSETLAPGSWTAVPDTGTLPQHRFSVPVGTRRGLYLRLKVTGP
jgi:N-acetyl-anhydromuramyl-L-alanine amidase AmpD